MARKSVCIIGAGPAGLVAAKVLLQTQRFDVTIYEKSHRIGGIWALDEHSKDGFLSPQTPTNLSRFTVAFSDLAWKSIDLENLPIFPKAWQVNQYLEEYRRRYIPEPCLHLGQEVLAVEHDRDWFVTLPDGKHRFDHVIMASGFFAAARPIEQTVSEVKSSINLVHSSRFRQLTDLLPEHQPGKTILIIGGGNSAGEAAGVVAGQLSSAQNGPDRALRERYRDVRILHVTPHSLYALPPFLPADESGKNFTPLDFSFYDLAKRPGTVVAAAGISSQPIRDMLHDGIQKSIGSDQNDLGSTALIAPKGETRGAVQVALSETYAEFVRSGLIEVKQGRIISVADGKRGGVAILQHDGKQEQLEDIGGVLYATGYSPIPALDLLDDRTKEELQFDGTSMRLPLILEQWQTMNDAVPSIAFHGFYEGPYWGVMEMQARLTASRWLGGGPDKTNAYEEKQLMLNLRKAMHEKHVNVPQYWLGDYGGYMEEMAVALQLNRNDGKLGNHDYAVTPARYLLDGDDKREATIAMLDMSSTWEACAGGKYAARAIFRAMQGKWSFSRRIESKIALPSGIVEGIATFAPRAPTNKAGSFDAEYLYTETGIFRPDVGGEMTVSRSYVYRYSEAKDQLSVWFVKPDSPFEVDYLFHDLVLSGDSAKADHLCVADMYRTEYSWAMKGILLMGFEVIHAVKGPQKDYVSTTKYARPSKVV